MNGFRRFEIFDPSCPLFFKETSIFTPKTLTFPSFTEEIALGFALNPSPLDLFQIEKTPPCFSSYKMFQEKAATQFHLQTLSDRVSALELGFDQIVKSKSKTTQDRKYTWTAEIASPDKDGIDRKYKWMTEIKGVKKKHQGEEKDYKWIAEFKGKGINAPISHKYTFQASTAAPAKKKKSSDKKQPTTATRVVEIEEPVAQGVSVLKQAFAKRNGAGNNGKGKKKELSPKDAAMMIQMSFRAYLIRRSQVLRALRELAVAKAKLKEIMALFNNFLYRRCISRDAEERQKFSEKIIVLLLTVDAIEGADLMVRSARRSMIDELEAMLNVVDPQPAGKLGSMKRRKFDLPDGGIQQEIAAGVAEVVQMLDQDEKNGVNTFEVCL